MGELLGRGDDYGLYVRGHAAVGVGYRPFVLEVEHVPDPAHDMVYAQLAADVDGQPVIFDHAHPVHAGDGLPYDILFLGVGEETHLVLVDSYGDDHVVEHGQGAGEYVEVPGREGVEGPREQSCPVHSHKFKDF